jgi:hypothetical protein
MRKRRRKIETIERQRAKSEREAEPKIKNAHETLAQKYFPIFPTSIAVARSTARGARKSGWRLVARTPNRIFCNKKIFRLRRPRHPVEARRRPIRRRIEYGRFAAGSRLASVDRQTS